MDQEPVQIGTIERIVAYPVLNLQSSNMSGIPSVGISDEGMAGNALFVLLDCITGKRQRTFNLPTSYTLDFLKLAASIESGNGYAGSPGVYVHRDNSKHTATSEEFERYLLHKFARSMVIMENDQKGILTLADANELRHHSGTLDESLNNPSNWANFYVDFKPAFIPKLMEGQTLLLGNNVQARITGKKDQSTLHK